MSEITNPVRPSAIRRFGPVLVAVSLAGVAVLYGFARGGKESPSTECADAATTAARIAPLAHGEVAALAVSKRPATLTDVEFLNPAGQPMHLSDMRGKIVLLNLWATWCIPCREEMPSLDRLQSRLGGANFEVAAINLDTTRLERRKPFLESAGVKSLAFYADPGAEVFQKLKKAGKVVGLPTTILLDARGCELGIMPGPADWGSEDAAKLVEAAIHD